MAETWETNEFYQAVIEEGKHPSGQLQLPEVLRVGTRQLVAHFAPLLISGRAGYCIRRQSYAVSGREYVLPRQSIAGRVARAWLSDDDAGVTGTTPMFPVVESVVEDVITNRNAYLVRDHTLTLLQDASQGFLQVLYYRRPGRLVSSIDPTVSQAVTVVGASTLTVAAGSAIAGGVYDVVRGFPGFETLVSRVSASFAAGVYTFSGASLSSVSVGDWIVAPETAPLVQLPIEFHPALVLRTTATCLSSRGFPEQAAVKFAEASDLETRMMELVTPRVAESQYKPVTPAGSPGDTSWSGYGYSSYRRF